MTFPVLTQQELVRAFAEEFPQLKLRDDDFTNPQVVLFYYHNCISSYRLFYSWDLHVFSRCSEKLSIHRRNWTFRSTFGTQLLL